MFRPMLWFHCIRVMIFDLCELTRLQNLLLHVGWLKKDFRNQICEWIIIFLCFWQLVQERNIKSYYYSNKGYVTLKNALQYLLWCREAELCQGGKNAERRLEFKMRIFPSNFVVFPPRLSFGLLLLNPLEALTTPLKHS